MKLVIGSDHGGYELKQLIQKHLEARDIPVTDMGCYGPESVDYPDIAREVAHAVAADAESRGILICGTGIGISIAANKVPGIRAALCHDTTTARLAALHNNANILCIGGRTTGPETARDIVDSWLDHAFEGGRHQRRLDKIRAMEPDNNPLDINHPD